MNIGDQAAVYPENECKPPWLIKCLKCGSNKKARASGSSDNGFLFFSVFNPRRYEMAYMVIIQRVKNKLSFFAILSQSHVAQKPQMVGGISDRASDDSSHITDTELVFHREDVNDFGAGVIGQRLEDFCYPF
ncbi:hypothetical protein FB479_11578 [Brevibacillus sp. AG162]|nr:hypothetical protein FB479_11578 [Brevibacillus sp. AG162]